MPPVSPKSAAFWRAMAWSRSSARITPSTGPKHSVQVELRCPAARRASRPGATGAGRRRPGAGSTSHRSPGSSVGELAQQRRRRGGRMSGPTRWPGRSAGPTRRLRTASASRAWKRGSSWTEASTMARLAAEHFWPAWPNAERTRSRMAWSRSAAAVIDDGVLAARLGVQRAGRGCQPRNSRAVSQAPVRTTASTSGWVTRRRPTSSSAHGTNCSTSAGTPAAQHCRASERGGEHRLGRRLEDRRRCRRRARRTRRRPGWRTGSSTARRRPRPPVRAVEPLAERRRRGRRSSGRSRSASDTSGSASAHRLAGVVRHRATAAPALGRHHRGDADARTARRSAPRPRPPARPAPRPRTARSTWPGRPRRTGTGASLGTDGSIPMPVSGAARRRRRRRRDLGGDGVPRARPRSTAGWRRR